LNDLPTVPATGTPLERLGWNDHFAHAFELLDADELVPGRVAAQHRGAAVVFTEAGEVRAREAGALRHAARTPSELPAVGDWVALRRRSGGAPALIEAVLPRRTAFSRRGAGSLEEEQLLAANVDVAFIVFSAGHVLDGRLLERYVTTAMQGGARPVVVLSKADLLEDRETLVAEVRGLAPDVPVLVLSNVTGEGLDGLDAFLTDGVTGAVLGPSGVGKSTLVNHLAGRDVLATAETRADGEGRHTTSHRELVVLPRGGLIVDTPGLRELQLWTGSEGLDDAFTDITALAEHCRFRDCAHQHEPGCAVLAAAAEGTLEPQRLKSYRALERELEALGRKGRRRGRG